MVQNCQFKKYIFKKSTLFVFVIIISLCFYCTKRDSDIIDKSDVIILKGSPEEVGRKWAEVNGEEIKMNFNNFLRDKGLSEEEIVSKGQKYLSIIQELAPHWQQELNAIAQTLNLNADALCVYMGAKYRDVNLKDCFSYMVTPNLTKGGKTLYHKNRDNRYRHQSAYIKHVMIKGKRIYKYIGIGDVSDVGLMMMVNEKGLAGAADTGPPDPKPRWTGLMNPDILR